MIGDFLEAMARRTGWSFTVLGGGPDVAKDGNIRTISLHTGKDAYEQTFPKAIPNYIDTVLAPYSKFLESVYRESPTFPDDFALKKDECSAICSKYLRIASRKPNSSVGGCVKP